MGKRNTGFPPAVQDIISGRSGGFCEVRIACAGVYAVHKHHRRNRGAGGSKRSDTNLASNGLDACLLCHEYIGRNPKISYESGWLVRQSHDPLATPVLLRGVWHLLDNHGFAYRIPTPAGGKAS